jgi:hypothetical protein
MRVYELEAGACAGAGAAVALLTAAANGKKFECVWCCQIERECLIDEPFKRISNFVAIMNGQSVL